MVLLVVLIVVAMLALGAYSFVQLMNVEARGAQSYGRLVQARAAADSGVHYTAAILLDQKFGGILGSDIYDASSMFHGQVVTDQAADSPRLRCRFSVLAPYDSSDDAGSWRYGLIDECSRVNLSTVLLIVQAQQGSQSGSGTGGGDQTGTGGGTETTTNPLLYLPNMTPEIADAILDWLDEDDTPRENGAESELYQALNPPYQPRNGPLHSLDELLLVAGVTPRLLYGEDANRNGILDPNEDDGDLSYPDDDSNGTLDRGWLPYLTLYTREANRDVWDMPRIYLNDNELEALFDTLSHDEDFGEEKATFIIAYRLFGPAASGQQPGASQNQTPQGPQPQGDSGRDQTPPGRPPNSEGGQPPNQPPSNETQQGGQQSGQGSSSSTQVIAGLDASGGPKQQIQSVVDLIGATVNAKQPGNAATKELKSPFLESEIGDYLDMLLDRTTTSESEELAGRVNVNTAPWPVLMALPGLTEDLADSIISARGTSDWSEALSDLGVAWLLSSGSVTKDQFKRMEPFITGRSRVFRLQAAGYYEEGGLVARIEAVLDLSGSSPRVRYWRDLSRLGRGFDPQVLMGTVSH